MRQPTKFFLRASVFAAIAVLATVSAIAQRPDGAGGIYKARITPHWLADGKKFWYENTLPRTARVRPSGLCRGKPKTGIRPRTARRGSQKADVAAAATSRLVLAGLVLDLDAGTMTFRAAGKDWRCDLASYELTELKEPPSSKIEPSAVLARPGSLRASRTGGEETELLIDNRSAAAVEIFWIDTSGQRQTYGKVAPGEQSHHRSPASVGTRRCRRTVVWRCHGRRQQPHHRHRRADDQRAGGGRAKRRQTASRARSRPSPDRRWSATIEDHNIVLRAVDSGTKVSLTTDGREGRAYGLPSWSPDSKHWRHFGSSRAMTDRCI